MQAHVAQYIVLLLYANFQLLVGRRLQVVAKIFGRGGPKLM